MYSWVSGSDVSVFFFNKMLHQFPQLSISWSRYDFIKSLSPQNCVFYFQAAALICMQPWQRNSGVFVSLFVFYYFGREGGWDGPVSLYSCEPVMNLLTVPRIIVCEHVTVR